MKRSVVLQLWPESLQHHIVTALEEAERERNRMLLVFFILTVKCKTKRCPQQNSLIMLFWSSSNSHLNVEVFKGYCVSPEQLHGIPRYKGDAEKALHLVRPWPLCHLRHKMLHDKSTGQVLSPVFTHSRLVSSMWTFQILLTEVRLSVITGLKKDNNKKKLRLKDQLQPSSQWNAEKVEIL